MKRSLSALGCFLTVAAVACLFIIPAGKICAEESSPQESYFTDVRWLNDNLSRVTIVDARPARAYARGHIPGAVSTPWQYFADMTGKPGEPGWGTLLAKEVLSEKLSAKGISPQKPVVVYSKTPGWGEDGRIAWMLLMAGFTDVRMLDGGVRAWKQAGGPLVKSAEEPVKVLTEVNNLDEGYTASTDWIRAHMEEIVLVDSRTRAEFLGARKYGEARGGRLPGAILVPFEEMFDKEKRIRPTQELRELFAKAGIEPEDRVVVYCTGGIRSAHMVLILRMAGFPYAANYDASFYEWAGNPELELE